MTPEQAIALIDKVLANYHGTRQDHVDLLRAIETVKGAMSHADHCDNSDQGVPRRDKAIPKIVEGMG